MTFTAMKEGADAAIAGLDAAGDEVEGAGASAAAPAPTPSDTFARLHGAVRALRQVSWRGRDERGADTARASKLQAGRGRVGPGARVRLRPSLQGTGMRAMFLTGQFATVRDVLLDVQGMRMFAVALDEEVRQDLQLAPDGLLHFHPDEVEFVGN